MLWYINLLHVDTRKLSNIYAPMRKILLNARHIV